MKLGFVPLFHPVSLYHPDFVACSPTGATAIVYDKEVTFESSTCYRSSRPNRLVLNGACSVKARENAEGL